MEYSQYINRVELQGIVGTSKVISIGDKKVVRFSLSTNYAYKDKEGYPVIETTWHACSAWAEKEDDLTKYRKGTPLYIEGRIRHIRYTDASGFERTTLEVVATKIERVEL